MFGPWCFIKKRNFGKLDVLRLIESIHTNEHQDRFRRIVIWPFNFEPMKGNLGLSEGLVGIIEGGILSSFFNATNFYLNRMDEDGLLKKEVEDEDLGNDEPPTNNIANFLKMPQEIVCRIKPKIEFLIDYSQTQILTLDVNVKILHSK